MNMKEKLESLGRNSIQLKIARKETYKLGATRFGGKPDVPPDFVWPTYEGESYDHVVKDRPLTFLAQFNCEELAQFDKEHLLPDHGLLSFFYETDTQCWGYDPKDKGCARVYWFEDLSALSAANFPADMEEDFKFPMVKIKMDSKSSYPSWQDFSEVFPDEEDDDAFNDAFYEAYSKALDEHEEVFPVDEPKVDIDAINADGVTFHAVVTVKPEVTLGDYKGMKWLFVVVR